MTASATMRPPAVLIECPVCQHHMTILTVTAVCQNSECERCDVSYSFELPKFDVALKEME